MSKELTEKWKNGELENGYYWCRLLDNEVDVFMCHLVAGHFEFSTIKEILAPVPSYEELQKLKEQLQEANEVVKLYAETFIGNKNEDGTFTVYCFGSFPTNKNVYGYQELRYDPRPANDYLKKWGVK